MRQGDSKRRPVKRKEDGSANAYRHVESWTLTASDAVGRFLGVNIGTPLQRKLSKLALLLFGIAIVCALIVLGANEFSDNTQVIIYAVATGLSMIPASLIVVLTITMAVGTKRMVSRHVIVRNLKSLEALGAVTNICSDKTGTLTQGRMVAKKCWIPTRGTYSVGTSSEPYNPTLGDLSRSSNSPSQQAAGGEGDEKPDGIVQDFAELLKDNRDLEEFLKVASLANLAKVHKQQDGEWTATGDPTEIAIQVFACRFGYDRHIFVDPTKPKVKEVGEYGFDSDVKKMSVIIEEVETGQQVIYTKGAVERVLDSCTLITWHITAAASPTARART